MANGKNKKPVSAPVAPAVEAPEEVNEEVQEEGAEEVEASAPEAAPEAKAPAFVVPTPAVTNREAKIRKSSAQVGGIKPVQAQVSNRDSAPELPDSAFDMVEIMIDEPIHVNGKRLYGLVKVPRHEFESIVPMIQAKKRADVEVFTGRNYRVDRDLNNRLIVREVGDDES